MMKDIKLAYLSLFIISATVICFEIIATRVSSVIFVNNYAFIVLSLAILGLGTGGIYSYYRKRNDNTYTGFIFNSIIATGSSFVVFIVAVIVLKITNAFLYFLLLFFPFFFAGIIYAQIFKIHADNSFKLYASDLGGAAIGSLVSLFVFDIFGAPNSILVMAVLILSLAGIFFPFKIKKYLSIFYSILILSLTFLIVNGNSSFLGKVPIGEFSEKDYYYVYPNAKQIAEITDSRWSIYGRSDLVQYSNQEMVKQLFIDGAAGSPMYAFNGNIRNPGQLLYSLIVSQSNAVPFFFLKEPEKNNMLIIGPGGGKEVLLGLFAGVNLITGVEINRDFVQIVKEHRDFNGGIYTDFPNVEIQINEGRHFIKQTPYQYDLVVIALPSTEQLQSIDNFAMSENYLLTVEALQDYLNLLTPEGRVIFTVHNKWELIRLITTSLTAFNNLGISDQEALNHFLILEQDFAPTIVITKNEFTQEQVTYTENIIKTFPKEMTPVTYLPYHWHNLKNTTINELLHKIQEKRIQVGQYVAENKYNISPCRDNSPYFYKIKKGVPEDFLWLLISVAVLNIVLISQPLLGLSKKVENVHIRTVLLMLAVFCCIGIGFIIIEVSLFQKLVLYLGSPTTSLSVLLISLLIGMGLGSFFSQRIFKKLRIKKILIACIAIVVTGILIFTFLPMLLAELLIRTLLIRALVCVLFLIPLGFFLGIPFPAAIQILKQHNFEKYIPWMYGVNGTMTVLGSVLAVIVSMIFGFSISFYLGLIFYVTLVILIIGFKINSGLNSN